MDPQVEYLISLEYDQQRSAEWLKLRGNMLTASDAGTAIGVNPYETIDDFILKKCGHNSFKGNQATEWGNKYEDEARDIYTLEYNETVHEIGLYPHPKFNWLGGSPDGVTSSGKLIEIKCPLRRKITKDVPVYYMAQVQMLLEILNLESAVFIEYKPAQLTWPNPYEFVVTEVPRDRDWWAEAFPKMESVWNKVLWHRSNGIDGLVSSVKPKKPRVRKKKECLIEDDPNVFSNA